MNTKGLSLEIKDEAKGLVKAVFATFNVIDSDGDVTLPGAFEDGAPVRISAYGHASWSGALPVGKGIIRTTDTEAILEGQFFLNTQHGRDTFTVVKELGPLQEWSYGFDIEEESYGEFEGRQVRFLKKVKTHEVSPVLLGAGVNTRTLAAKSAGSRPDARRGRKAAIPPHETEVVARSWDGAAVVAGLPDDARPSELRTVFAWVDGNADPEAKSSYKFPHHHGINGPANVRACLAGIAILNGARGGADIPEADREGVYRHLAAHLRDADREPPELRAQPGGPMKFAEEGHHVLAVVSAFVDRAKEVVALRRAKGRGLAPSSAELMSWIADEMKRLESLLSTPLGEEDPTDEEIASLVAASLARIHGI
ncbi:MAG: HK97 family phage prohead protease [Microbispora sp.]|nr:HK97 family phage prohead protease [Microbispora sp.]